MKTRGYLFLLSFAVILMVIGIACNIPTTQPTQQPPIPTQSNNNTVISNAFITFTDKNKVYQIEIPADWKHTFNNGNHAYIDQFKSPDGNALVENIVYNDSMPFAGTQAGKFALMLLHQFHSSTGKEGDIHISGDNILKDGSERLTWTSPSRGYSGLSFFEVRGGVNFLMFTIEWANDYQNKYIDILDKIHSSYKVP